MNELASIPREVLITEQGLEKEKGFPEWDDYRKAGGVLPEVTFGEIVDFWQDTQREAEDMAAEVGIEMSSRVIDYYRILRGDMGGLLSKYEAVLPEDAVGVKRSWSNKTIWVKAVILAGDVPVGGFELDDL